jgi:hypothetical protein
LKKERLLVSLNVIRKLVRDIDDELENPGESRCIKGRMLAPFELNYLETDPEVNSHFYMPEEKKQFALQIKKLESKYFTKEGDILDTLNTTARELLELHGKKCP